MDWYQVAKQISDATGKSFSVASHRSVGGGCINSAYVLSGGDVEYFVKLNSASQLDMFVAEAAGLDEISAANAVRVPKPVCYGTANGQAYLVMENLHMGGGGGRAAMQQFGHQLAAMHRDTQSQFGWRRDNTIGSTPQPNDLTDEWLQFWRAHRLGFQLQLAKRHGCRKSLLDKGERLMADMGGLFADHDPQPSLLHGDLWSGNYGITQDGEPVIFDPAVYFGDREADLAMTELFGGFGRTFYDAYNEAWPLDPGYRVRKTFYNLYHILNHFNLFGGGYAGQAESMTDALLSELS
jgi:fructosamine-3-kinase